MIRLDENKLNLLRSIKKNYNLDLYLFWSRVDSKKKWWDIDLLVFNKNNDISNLELSLIIEREFFKKFEEKIDVIVFWKKLDEKQEIFYNSIKKVKIC